MDSEDLRIIKTRESLRSAMVELLTEKTFEKISVQDICKRAGVHRTTLYKHFNDKYELFAYVLHVMKEKIYDIDKMYSMEFKTVKDVYLYIFDKLLDYIDERKDKLKLMARNILDEPIFSAFVDFSTKRVSHFLERHTISQPKCPNVIMAHFLTGGMIYVISWWLENPNKYTKAQLLDYIDRTIISSIS